MDETRRSTPPRPDPPRSEVGEHGVSSPADVRRPSGDGTGPAADLRPELETPLPSPPRLPRRGLRRLVLPVLVLVLVGAAAAGVWYWRENLGIVRTDNAQTAGDLAPVSSRVPGTVIRVDVTDNQFVRAGTVLVELDPTDYRLALDQAKAQLTAAQAQVQAARAALDLAQKTVDRDRLLYADGAIAAQQVESDTTQLAAAQARYQSAEDALREARADLAIAEASRHQVTIARETVAISQGQVARAQAELQQAEAGEALVRQRAHDLAVAEAQAAAAEAAVRTAEVNLARTRIVAPSDGWV